MMAAVWSEPIGFATWMTCWVQQGVVERRLGLESEELGNSSKELAELLTRRGIPLRQKG